MATWLAGYTRNPKQDGGTHLSPVTKLALHSTETGSLPGYPGTAPTITLNPRTEQRWQHQPLERAGRALARPRGSGQTNRAGVIQVEIIGTCERSFAKKWGYLYLPDMNDRQIAWLGAELGKISRAAGIPIRSTLTWRQYPASYGNSPVRLRARDFENYRGWLGHQHVPWNDHGDCGDIPITALLAAAAGTPTLKEILDMNLDDPIESRAARDIDPKTGRGKTVRVRDVLMDIQATCDASLRLDAAASLERKGYGTRTEQIQDEVDRLIQLTTTSKES